MRTTAKTATKAIVLLLFAAGMARGQTSEVHFDVLRTQPSTESEAHVSALGNAKNRLAWYRILRCPFVIANRVGPESFFVRHTDLGALVEHSVYASLETLRCASSIRP